MEPWDVTIVGGGILGTSLAYWLADQYDARIAVLEREAQVAEHTSRRNTGVIHRPFYLDPEKRRVFARSAQVSYGLWKAYAAAKGLPFVPVGTLEVATSEDKVATLEEYRKWGLANGMDEGELQVLSPEEVREREPNIRCHGAILSRTDTAVDYHEFTTALRADAEAKGARFLTSSRVEGIEARDDYLILRLRGNGEVVSRFLINAAGGSSLDIAQMMGLGLEYSDLNFRGEYWVLAPDHAGLANTNIYSVPAHPELPFLDPHWIVRHNGKREIGPNAVPVPSPYMYAGLFRDPGAWLRKFFRPPVANKVALLFNRDFIALAAEEWLSSLSRDAMAQRVREFLPALQTEYLVARGTAGVRASVIDDKGNFLKEAIELEGPHSFHITNYNSPGATGAPAYAAHMVDKLAGAGMLDHLNSKAPSRGIFDYSKIIEALGVGRALARGT